MSPTLLEVTLAVVAAVLVFLFAVRAVPLVIDWLSQFFRHNVDVGDPDEKETNRYER